MIYPWSCGAKIAIQTDVSMCLRKFQLVTHRVWRLAVERFITNPTFFPGCWTAFVRTVSLNQYINLCLLFEKALQCVFFFFFFGL